MMNIPSAPEIVLIALGGFVMVCVMLSAIGRTAMASASDQIDERRKREAQRRAEDAEAEVRGHAAALEPLALNADGTIEEPIVAVVEKTE
jgi:hypothetical protein